MSFCSAVLEVWVIVMLDESCRCSGGELHMVEMGAGKIKSTSGLDGPGLTFS